MMMSVLDDLWPEPFLEMWQKCERPILKTEDEWFRMSATLSGVIWNVPANCVGLAQQAAQYNKICANADKQWSKRNTALLSALTSRNRPKTSPPSSPTSSVVTNFGYLGMTLRWNSSHLRGRLQQLHHDWRKHKFRAMSNQCWFVFVILKASCIRNLSHQDSEWKILLQCSEANGGKHPTQMSRQVA